MTRLTIVNFHYVGDPGAYEHPGIHPVAPGDFAALVDRLAAARHMATPEEVARFAKGEPVFADEACFLTFDDGLKEHAGAVRQVLEARGIRGAFFVASRPLADNRPLTVNATHWLRATTPPGAFRDELTSHLTAAERETLATSRSEATRIYIYDTPEVAEVKYLLSYQLPAERTDTIVARMLADRGTTPEALVERLYMSADDIAALAAEGHEIGAHGRNHRPLAELSAAAADADVRHCVATLRAQCGVTPRWLAYPYGNARANPENPAALLADNGLELAFTMLKGDNAGGRATRELSRITPNELTTDEAPA